MDLVKSLVSAIMEKLETKIKKEKILKKGTNRPSKKGTKTTSKGKNRQEIDKRIALMEHRESYCLDIWTGAPIVNKCPDCHNIMIGIEYSHDHPEHYDGISEWQCPNCKLRLGRWTNKRLRDGEIEHRMGKSYNNNWRQAK